MYLRTIGIGGLGGRTISPGLWGTVCDMRGAGLRDPVDWGGGGGGLACLAIGGGGGATFGGGGGFLGIFGPIFSFSSSCLYKSISRTCHRLIYFYSYCIYCK